MSASTDITSSVIDLIKQIETTSKKVKNKESNIFWQASPEDELKALVCNFQALLPKIEQTVSCRDGISLASKVTVPLNALIKLLQKIHEDAAVNFLYYPNIRKRLLFDYCPKTGERAMQSKAAVRFHAKTDSTCNFELEILDIEARQLILKEILTKGYTATASTHTEVGKTYKVSVFRLMGAQYSRRVSETAVNVSIILKSGRYIFTVTPEKKIATELQFETFSPIQ